MRMTSYDGIYADLTDQIIRAAIEVHRELGCGLKEEAYETSDIRPVAKAIERRRTDLRSDA